jgi:hypothetical protein
VTEARSGGEESDLLVCVRDFLTVNGVPYVLVRNYEGYPDHLTGDVDLYVPLEQVVARLDSLRRVIEGLGWVLANQVRRPWVLVMQAIKVDVKGDRGILVFEFFDRFQWLGFEYVPFDAVVRLTAMHNGFCILPPAAGYMITVCHYFFWVGFLPSKYRRAVAQFLDDGPWSELLPVYLGWIATRLHRHTKNYATLRDDQWTVQAGIPEPIFRYPRTFWMLARAVLVAKACWRSPIKGVRSIVRIAGAAFGDLTKPQGRILAVDLSDESAEQLLFQFKKYHLYKNSRSRVVKADSGWTGIRALIAGGISWVRGGLCIVNLRDSAPLVRTLVLRSKGLDRPEINSLSDEPERILRTIVTSRG